MRIHPCFPDRNSGSKEDCKNKNITPLFFFYRKSDDHLTKGKRSTFWCNAPVPCQSLIWKKWLVVSRKIRIHWVHVGSSPKSDKSSNTVFFFYFRFFGVLQGGFNRHTPDRKWRQSPGSLPDWAVRKKGILTGQTKRRYMNPLTASVEYTHWKKITSIQMKLGMMFSCKTTGMNCYVRSMDKLHRISLKNRWCKSRS